MHQPLLCFPEVTCSSFPTISWGSNYNHFHFTNEDTATWRSQMIFSKSQLVHGRSRISVWHSEPRTGVPLPCYLTSLWHGQEWLPLLLLFQSFSLKNWEIWEMKISNIIHTIKKSVNWALPKSKTSALWNTLLGEWKNESQIRRKYLWILHPTKGL